MNPLTVEELKALEVGDWVWLIDTDSGNGTYAQLFCVGKDMLQFSTALNVLPPHIYSEYGTKWLAYKNKEEAEGVYDKLQAECDDKERYTIELYNRAREAERRLSELKEKDKK